jgi:hypothetical protein
VIGETIFNDGESPYELENRDWLFLTPACANNRFMHTKKITILILKRVSFVALLVHKKTCPCTMSGARGHEPPLNLTALR